MRYPDPELNIKELSGKLFLEIRNTLNQASEHRNWRKLLEIADRDFHYRQDQVASFGNFVLNAGSGGPATAVLNDLGGRGCTVRQLTTYLNALRLEKIVLQLKNTEPIIILRQPDSSITVLEGECLEISVSGTGLPYPRYLWYHCNDEKDLVRLEEQTDALLKIKLVRSHHAGHYCCQLYNSNQGEVVQSDYCEVLVKPNPNAVFEDDYPQASGLPNNNPCDVLYNRINNIDISHGPAGNSAANAGVALHPVILHQPHDETVEENGTVKFTVVVQGQSPLQYTWYKDESIIRENSLVNVIELNKLTIDDVGVYKCSVQNAYGTATTLPFALKIIYQQAAPSEQNHKIILQPQSITVSYGGVAKFRCEVTGGCDHSYQWYKDGSALQGADGKEYEIKICDNVERYSGEYYCKIITTLGELVSHPATLKIDIPSKQQQFRATDKVALLIGNSDYKCAKKLYATEGDIKKLRDVLRKQKFKVVSLLNLTLTEMESAIDEFCALLGNGVYGFFYFCGHGFEEHAKQYMVPYDAPHAFVQKDCLCLTDVVIKLSMTVPALICVVLDMCRKRLPHNTQPSRDEQKEHFEDLDESFIRPNQAFLFATTYRLEAYETPTEGLLMKVLPDEIVKEQSVEKAFSNVKKAFSTMDLLKDSGKCQFPDTGGNLNEDRSLTDPICADGYTQEFTRRQERWAELCEKPRRHCIQYKHGIVIDLDFQDAASNILIVFISVQWDEKQTSECSAYVCKVPTSVYKDDDKIIAKRKRQTTIRDIQRIKDDLIITIRVDYKLVNGSERQSNIFGYNLKQPLCAKLQLDQSRNRHAMENDET